MNPIVSRYKIPFLFSLVIGLALVVLGNMTHWLSAVFAFLGTIVGMILIDAEYIVHSYIVDPSGENSLKIKDYLAQKNISGLVDFLNKVEHSFGEMAVRSTLFQVILTVFSFYTIVTETWVFPKALVLSMVISLWYVQLLEFAKTKTLKRWFWIYNGEMSARAYTVYLFSMLLLFVLQFAFV